MNKAIIKLTEKNITLRVAEPCPVGTLLNWDIQMPTDAHLDKITVSGTVTECAYAPDNGSGDYLLEVAFSEMSPVDQAILRAYIEFQDRETDLNKFAADHRALHQTFQQFSRALSQFITAAEWMLQQPTQKVTLH